MFKSRNKDKKENRGLKIMQIGNSGGFDFQNVNSSFLITDLQETEYILFDCGYNVPDELIRLESENLIDLSKLKNIFISHQHDDHFGGLVKLGLYLQEKYKIVLNIYLPFLSSPVYNMLDSLNYEYCDSGRYVKKSMRPDFHYGTIKEVIKFPNEIVGITSFPTKHICVDSFGLSVKCDEDIIVFTSDTTASKAMLKQLKSLSEFVLVHDHSPGEFTDVSVHATYDNMKNIYGSKFVSKLYFTHDSSLNRITDVGVWKEVSKMKQVNLLDLEEGNV